MSLSEADRAFYAHSLADRERQYWQPLAEHLRAVAKGAQVFRVNIFVKLSGMLAQHRAQSLRRRRRLARHGDTDLAADAREHRADRLSIAGRD